MNAPMIRGDDGGQKLMAKIHLERPGYFKGGKL
jgi:hypothetical protein